MQEYLAAGGQIDCDAPDLVFHVCNGVIVAFPADLVGEALAIRGHSSSVDHVIDIGSCLGVTAILAAPQIGVGNVLCIESDERLHKVIERNFQLNELKPPRLLDCVISHRSGKTNAFKTSGAPWSNHLSDLNHVPGPSRDVLSIQDLPYGSGATLMVIDIEGADLRAFEAGVPKGVTKIILETHPARYDRRGFAKIFTELSNAGFEYISEGSRGELVCFERFSPS
ncbi:MAG: FkbM family methyltransferase [Pseudomonadota bacterium]